MKLKDQIKNRQQLNREILKTLDWNVIAAKYPELADQVEAKIEACGQLRFGQIVANLLPDYRSEHRSAQTEDIFKILFEDLTMDPFFEESYETLIRLQ